MVIEVQNLHKSFGSTHVLDDVSFELAAGQVAALAGRNGAGKTTLIDILMGFRSASSGQARILGSNVIGRGHLSRVGWAPESPAFPRTWTAAQVLEFQRQMQPGSDDKTIKDLVERFELDPTKKTRDMSRGEIARVALVCALGHKPDLLLLDDPTLGLDPMGRRLLVGEVLGAVAEEGTAVLVSTHLLDEIAPALDRVLVLAHGRVTLDSSVTELDGPLEDLFEEYTR